MQITGTHTQDSATEGKFTIQIGAGNPWDSKQVFPYDQDGEMTFEIAQQLAMSFIDGARAMHETTKAQMNLRSVDRDIRHASLAPTPKGTM